MGFNYTYHVEIKGFNKQVFLHTIIKIIPILFKVNRITYELNEILHLC